MAKFDADRAGAVASLVCAVHCAAVGLLVSVLPLIGLAFLHEPWVEVSFYSLAVFFGVWAARRGWKLHRSWWPAIMFFAGLSLVGFGHWMAERHAEPNAFETLGHLLSAGGGLTLVAFHVLNARLTKSHACSCKVCAVHRHDDAGLPEVPIETRERVSR